MTFKLRPELLVADVHAAVLAEARPPEEEPEDEEPELARGLRSLAGGAGVFADSRSGFAYPADYAVGLAGGHSLWVARCFGFAYALLLMR